jgi:hypothetical protein
MTLFRYSSYDVPFWVRRNSRAGRWHEVGDPATQYWSMAPEAAWSELIRAEDLRSEADLDQLRMPLWVCRFPSAGLIDLVDDAVRSKLEISLDALVADDWGPCQRLGRELRLTHSGVIAPCASLERYWNVTMFGPLRQIDWRDRPALARTVPAAVAAIGRPPTALVDRVIRPADASGRVSLF